MVTYSNFEYVVGKISHQFNYNIHNYTCMKILNMMMRFVLNIFRISTVLKFWLRIIFLVENLLASCATTILRYDRLHKLTLLSVVLQ